MLDRKERKGRRLEPNQLKMSYHTPTGLRVDRILHKKSIAQTWPYRFFRKSRRPHNHPNQHTEAELKLIRDMRRRNPKFSLIELWFRLKQRDYVRRPESLLRAMRKLRMFPGEKETYVCKPYMQMVHPGQRL